MSTASGKTSFVPELRYEWVPARADRLPELRHAVAQWVRRVGLSSERAAEVELAVYEALANVVEHAYRDNGTLDLRAEYRPDPGLVEISVGDRGSWQHSSQVPGPTGGRGLVLMRRLADTVDIDTARTGTTVRFRWWTSPESGAGAGKIGSDGMSRPHSELTRNH